MLVIHSDSSFKKKKDHILILTLFFLLLFLCLLCLSSPLIFPGVITYLPCPYIDFYHLPFFSTPQSDIYFVSTAPVSSASNCSSRDTSSQSSPQTPTGYEMPVFPSPLGDGKPGTVKTPEDVTFRFFKCQWCL